MVSDFKRAACLLLLTLSACAGNVEEEAPRFPRASSLGTMHPRTVEPSTPGQVQTAIYSWFLRAGYPAYQAAALVDHARIESGLNPCISGRGGRALYISMERHAAAAVIRVRGDPVVSTADQAAGLRR